MVRAIVALLAVAAIAAPAATAGKKPRPVDASTQQYVEVIPTASGNAAAGASKGSAPLPAAAAKRIRTQGGADAAALTTIATSAAYGAPAVARSASTPHSSTRPVRRKGTLAPAAAALPPVAAAPATHWSYLVAVLAAIAVAGVGGAVLRARRRPA